MKDALDFLEELCADDDNEAPTNVQALYIEPPIIDGDLSGEDDGDDDGGIPDNVCPAQLKSGCEIILDNGRRIETIEDVRSSSETGFNYDTDSSNTVDDSLPSSSKRICRVHPSKPDLPIPAANRDSKFTWCKDNSMALLPIFPEPVYEDCANLRPYELFEKFFNDDLLEHICKCSNLYATHHQKRYEELTTRGIYLDLFNVFYISNGCVLF